MNPDVNPIEFPMPDWLPVEVPDDGADVEDTSAAELIHEAVNHELQQRLWLKAIIPLLQLRSLESDPSDRVQFAFDQMHIAAAERVARLMRSDLPSVD